MVKVVHQRSLVWRTDNFTFRTRIYQEERHHAEIDHGAVVVEGGWLRQPTPFSEQSVLVLVVFECLTSTLSLLVVECSQDGEITSR
jgi:hypothetical protein